MNCLKSWFALSVVFRKANLTYSDHIKAELEVRIKFSKKALSHIEKEIDMPPEIWINNDKSIVLLTGSINILNIKGQCRFI